MPNEKYHSDLSLSNSGMSNFSQSPLHYWYNSPFNHEKEYVQTLPMKQGEILHTLILEPEKFSLDWKVKLNVKTSKVEGMIGEVGQAASPINGAGKVFVHGEYWQAESAEPVATGDEVEVIGIGDHMHLRVRPYKIPEV